MSGLPEHWYDHGGSLSAPCIGIGGDMRNENSGIGNPADDYYIQICGKCGHKLAAFQSAYGPADYGCKTEHDRFGETVCPECLTANFSHSTVIVTRGYLKEQDRSSKWWKRYLLNRADRAFWNGRMGNGSVAAMASGAEFMWGRHHELHEIGAEWNPLCPCCGVEWADDTFDFHHWDYDEDIGCMLCRPCHNYIHDGGTATEQAEKNRSDWLPHAVGRLVERARVHGLEFNDAYEIQIRFHIPRTDRADRKLSEYEAEAPRQ